MALGRWWCKREQVMTERTWRSAGKQDWQKPRSAQEWPTEGVVFILRLFVFSPGSLMLGVNEKFVQGGRERVDHDWGENRHVW